MGSVVEAVGDVVGGAINDVFGGVGDILDFVGLDSLGKEVSRWGEDVEQVIKTLSGEYASDVKRVKKYEETVNNKKAELEGIVSKYNANLDQLSERMESLIAFEEIFHMAIKNRIKNYQNIYGPEIDSMVTEYGRMVKLLEQMVTNLKSEYDFVIGLTEGAFVQRLVGSIIMIIGGVTSDMGDILAGKANSSTWTNIIIAIVLVIITIITWGAATAPAAGAWAMASAVLATIGAFMTLDGMYANGAATGAIMSALDFLFNDLLNLDDLVGSDFEKFDKDHEDYQDMVGFVKVAISLATIATSYMSSITNTAGSGASWNIGTASKYGTNIGSQQTQMLAMEDAAIGITNSKEMFGGALSVADTFGSSALFGVKFSTYSQIFDAFSISSKIGDYISANKQLKDMEEKLNADKAKLNDAIIQKTNKKMMASYKDISYFLQDQQEYIDRYVWSMTSNSMYVDPYGTTPVANIRFEPDRDTRVMSFGFEDVFDESTQAGSKSYFNNILYG